MPVLHDLVRLNDVERLVEELELLADPNSLDGSGLTPLHVLADKSERNNEEIEIGLEMARQLIRFGADVNSTTRGGEPVLIKAAHKKKYRMVELLLESNAEINARDEVGEMTALHQALFQIQDEFFEISQQEAILRTVQTLLRFNPDLKLEGFYNIGPGYMDRTVPFLQAVAFNYPDVVQEFLNRYSLDDLLITRPRDEGRALYVAFIHEEGDLVATELLRRDFKFRALHIERYIKNLMNDDIETIERSKYKFKLYLFASSREFNEDILCNIKNAKNCNLFEFVGTCKEEVRKMKEDEVAPGLSVYDMARRGFLHKSLVDEHVPFKAMEETFHRIKEYRYPVYFDYILVSICSPYMNKIFAEESVKIYYSDKVSLTHDAYYRLSFYLSHLDMLNMIRACYPELALTVSPQKVTWSAWLRRLNPISYCTVM